MKLSLIQAAINLKEEAEKIGMHYTIEEAINMIIKIKDQIKEDEKGA